MVFEHLIRQQWNRISSTVRRTNVEFKKSIKWTCNKMNMKNYDSTKKHHILWHLYQFSKLKPLKGDNFSFDNNSSNVMYCLSLLLTFFNHLQKANNSYRLRIWVSGLMHLFTMCIKTSAKLNVLLHQQVEIQLHNDILFAIVTWTAKNDAWHRFSSAKLLLYTYFI